ncbi:MAG: hypothetical protein OEY07_17405 [Gammaproteobacteria bacterium]|nr:hypothetical protein [Gammaproteobacteria bacterium]
MSLLYYRNHLRFLKILLLMLCCTFIVQGCDSSEFEKRQTAMNTGNSSLQKTSMLVTVTLDTLPGGLLKSDIVKVSLTNTGTTPRKVAARLAIGYEDSDEREIYAIIRDRATGNIVGKRSQLYDREPFHFSHAKELKPGETIHTEFHLLEWYVIPEGNLEIRIVYDPEEAAKQYPEITAHKLVSDFVPFAMKK